MAEPPTEALVTNLRYRSAWVAICEAYLRQISDPEVRALLEAMQEVEQEAVETLAALLRQRDISPMHVGSDERLLRQALNRRSDDARVNFIRQGLIASQKWYQSQAAETPEAAELWRELAEEQAALARRFAGLLSWQEEG
ncbi:MAG: hypothetical protein D6775_16585 [Caldilineae bacterium]|nr:MAG: hypothetical protein D6775_16585 [Caldilineae bacterium]